MAGGLLMGSVPFATAELTSDIASGDPTIPVDGTNGFPEPGIIVIDNERIAYSAKTGTTLVGSIARPLQRGANGTSPSAHTEGTTVRMVESMLMNNAVDYDLAILADTAGLQAFLTVPTAVFDVLLSFGRAPLGFLGTDLQILTVIWAVFFLGMVVSFFIMMAGGRRV